MKKRIYHVESIPKSFLWGGRKIIDKYNLKTDLENVGILYHVVALPGELDCMVTEAGEPLSVFYQKNRELFQCGSEFFPVRMATSCGENKMSYHLHPGDDYAIPHEGTRGKVTGAVALEEAEVVREKLFGNNARTRDEFKRMVEEKDWEHLFKKISQKQGDFLHTPAGVIHGGGGEGIMSMTFSSNSDITYRFYDYDRNNKDRKLHLQQVYECVNIPEVPLGTVRPVAVRENEIQIYRYYDQPGEYTAECLETNGSGFYERKEFYCLTCSDGSGRVGTDEVKIGDTLLIPAGYGKLELDGKMKLYLISYRE